MRIDVDKQPRSELDACPGRGAGLVLVADGISFSDLEQDLIAQRAAVNTIEPMTDGEAEPLKARVIALNWAIAEAPAYTPKDMAIKVRQIAEGLQKGPGVWHHRTVETLLECLDQRAVWD